MHQLDRLAAEVHQAKGATTRAAAIDRLAAAALQVASDFASASARKLGLDTRSFDAEGVCGLAVVEAIKAHRPRGRFVALLSHVVKHRVIDAARTWTNHRNALKGRTCYLEDLKAPDGHDLLPAAIAPDRAEAATEAKSALEAIRGLTGCERCVLRCLVAADGNNAQVARVLGVTGATVGNRLRCIKAKARRAK